VSFVLRAPLNQTGAMISTNNSKRLSNKQQLENFTVVTADSQTKGKGQMGAVWSSEPSKNLIMSILLKDFKRYL
jgi:BirA family biotin operon repressor/biotin-[acetyl-CoA-carboxylase] ligase